jgi:dihydroxyacid dehydratase/phosphogluconate dehydratase
MAAARHNRPTIIVYGGTIQPGVRHVDCPHLGYKAGDTVNISDAFESFGQCWTNHAPSFVDRMRGRCFRCRQNKRC